MPDSKRDDYLALHGERLIENGYRILPIVRGSKRPPFDDWQKLKPTVGQWRTWIEGDYRRAGVGLICGTVAGIDLDILDEPMSLAMQHWIEKEFGAAPVRIGMAPKRLMLFRVETPFSKIQSAYWEDPWGNPEAAFSQKGRKPVGHLRKIEILAQGQQFVAYAVHPETGLPFQWVTEASPLTVARDALPEITGEDCRAIVAKFEEMAAAAGWERVTSGRQSVPVAYTGSSAADDPFIGDARKVDLGRDEIRTLTMLVPDPHEYDRWRDVGMALWHQGDGEEWALDIWKEWSSQASNYDSDVCDAKWGTFDAEGKNRQPLTARYILKIAQEVQQQVAVETFNSVKESLETAADLNAFKDACLTIKKTEFDTIHRSHLTSLVQDAYKRITRSSLPLNEARSLCRYQAPAVETPEWLTPFVYVQLDSTFYNRKRAYSLTTQAFNDTYNRRMLSPGEIMEGKSVPDTFAKDFALNIVQVPRVYNKMYLPGEGDLFVYNGRRHVNRYDPNSVPETPETLTRSELAAIEAVKGHFVHMFENETDRRTLLDSIAFLTQNPSERLAWATLLQGVQGDGKTFFAGLLSAVLGHDNVSNLAAQAVEEKYNAWSEGTRVVFFEEIKLHDQNRFAVLDKVKPLLTNKVVSIRRMQTDYYQVANTVSYFLSTNYRDALPLEDSETRYLVLMSRWQSGEAIRGFKAANPDYYKTLYGALRHPGALRKWLLEHRVTPGFAHEDRAPDSEGRREMISFATSDIAEHMAMIIKGGGLIDCCETLVNTSTLKAELMRRDFEMPRGQTLNRLLVAAGFHRLGQVRIGDDTPGFWTKDPKRFRLSDGAVNTAAIRQWLKDDI